MYKNLPFILAGVFAVVVVTTMTLYIVPEGKQAIVTQFGRPIGEAITEAGLQVKLPWQDVRYFEKRILNWDGRPNQVVTKDKKYIMVDTTARWQISNPLMFLRTVQTELNGLSRISARIESVTRDVISSHNLVETVRNGNQILDEINARAEARQKAIESGEAIDVVEEEITGEIEPVAVGRDALTDKIVVQARAELEELGLSLIDVQLRRISYEESVQQKVYERMISERQRIAEKIRSVGKGEQAKIFGKTERELQEIQSRAYRKVQEIRGRAEGEAIQIYAEATGKDPEFYEFLRTLDAYRDGLRDDTTLILSSNSKFMKILKNGAVR